MVGNVIPFGCKSICGVGAHTVRCHAVVVSLVFTTLQVLVFVPFCQYKKESKKLKGLCGKNTIVVALCLLLSAHYKFSDDDDLDLATNFCEAGLECPVPTVSKVML